MENITILYIITKLELGGAQKVCLTLLQDIENENQKTFLITGTQGPLIDVIKNKKNVLLIDDLKRELSPIMMIKEIKAFFKIIKHIYTLRKTYPNLIVHTHSTKAGLVGRWAAFFAGSKHRVHTIHGYGFNDHQPKIIWTIIYLLELITSFITTHFVCVSQKDAETGKKLFPFFAHKYSLIHAAVDYNKFYQPARPVKKLWQAARRISEDQENSPEKKELITFGTISCFKKQKNLFDLLNAFNLVHAKHTNTRLEIIGGGIQRPLIESWIIQHNLINAVKLHGWQSNIVPLIQPWHALVMTSLWEGLPCTVVEARLSKLPVISYTTGGIPEVIMHKKNGLLYEQKDWNGIAQGMITLIEHPHLYRQMAEYPDNLEMFKNRTMVHKHINLYKSLQ